MPVIRTIIEYPGQTLTDVSADSTQYVLIKDVRRNMTLCENTNENYQEVTDQDDCLQAARLLTAKAFQKNDGIAIDPESLTYWPYHSDTSLPLNCSIHYGVSGDIMDIKTGGQFVHFRDPSFEPLTRPNGSVASLKICKLLQPVQGESPSQTQTPLEGVGVANNIDPSHTYRHFFTSMACVLLLFLFMWSSWS